MEYGPGKPKITRPKISIYEYAGIITQLAEHLFTLRDLDDYLEEPQVTNIIDPCKLAFKLLKEGKVDVQIDRGYETILFSEAIKDELIENEIEHYLNEREDDRKKYLIDRVF